MKERGMRMRNFKDYEDNNFETKDSVIDTEKNKIMLNKLLNFEDDLEDMEVVEEAKDMNEENKLEENLDSSFVEEKNNFDYKLKNVNNLDEENEHDFVQSLAKEISDELKLESIQEAKEEENPDFLLKKEIEKIEEESKEETQEEVRPRRRRGSLANRSRVKQEEILEEENDDEDNLDENHYLDCVASNDKEQVSLVIMLLITFIVTGVVIFATVVNLNKEENIITKIKQELVRK